ncbi:probable arginine--tRNA ligase, mitochondrial [Phymastichus coffea]|uniref:probable arginine--tRNA ligase, mitochondrial n=1 Tax=Phymastichus coffea TaxID=108790 RepID=UPI00273A9029|nr:probable arginine--tRNA ligase, mitochondrial [Phymastichus coffea]
MSNNLRYMLHKKISQALQNDKSSVKSSTVSAQLKLNIMKFSRHFHFTLPLKTNQYDICEIAPKLMEKGSDDFLEKVEISEKSNALFFYVERDRLVRGLFNDMKKDIKPPNLLDEKLNNVIVEFSSPNIAKPFHVGHLRSTVIGNYISNLNQFFKHNVKRINYLGDWGTQFGFVQLGLSLAKVTEDDLKSNPIKTLYNAYVQANKLAEEDHTVAEKAKDIFNKLEKGDRSNAGEWESFRKYTLEELEKTYDRIGIKFDEYEWESMYRIDKITTVISELYKHSLLKTDSEGRQVVNTNNRTIPIIKSDGSSLYITRDIAAAINRFEKHQFDAMYYVVDNAQIDHFRNLINILKAMKYPWADRLLHVKFGKIKGMSTRKGTAIFLQDILDEMHDVMREKQLKNPHTKATLDSNDPSTEILGLSAMIINDLRHKRNQDYDFSWDKALDSEIHSGVKLQYTHCRLNSLELYSTATIADECRPELLKEAVADNLMLRLLKYDEALIESYLQLEPCILVNYLFDLVYHINLCFKDLKIKDQPADLANQRLLLTHTARKVLGHGMTLLGITPLDKM